MKNDVHPVQVVLYEGRGALPWEAGSRLSLTASLLDQGYSVLRVTEAGSPARALLSTTGSPVIVLGRFTGPAPEFTDGAGTLRIATRDAGDLGVDDLLELVTTVRDELGAALNRPGQPGAWKPWFPVIDYDRCTNCMQCLSFCLFDVYGVDEDKRIQVQNNDNCKTNCPACSRVCPEAAIMFPKYKAGPINGDVVSDSDLNREKMKIDISALLGGDVYSLLRDRSERARSRFGKERDSDKALAERQKCLTKLAALAGDIPPEVLMSLPSPEEISRKAAEAAAKAEAALAAQPPQTA